MARAVIFDMDGVLCDSEPLICEAACLMFKERHEVNARPADFLPFIGTGEDRYLGGVAELHGAALLMPADKDYTYEIYLKIIKGRLEPLPGVLDFMAAARKQGCKLAVATSADRVKMLGNLRELGIPEESFNACVSGSEIVRKKPDPEIFLHASAKLDLSPASCLVIEDAPNGIKAARAAGMQAVGLTTSFDAAELRAAGAFLTARDLAQLLEEAGHSLFVA